ncbi:MAG: hypothetical protein ABGZ53_13405 [Fuerstiella sp.]
MSTDNQTPNTVSSLVMAKAGDPVPAGQYKAKFLRCEESAGNPAYGPAYRWAWEVLEGEFAGREISTITSQKVNPQSNSGKLIALLNGSPVDSDQTVDLQAFVGQTYLCSVVESGNGTKVDTVFRI